MANEGSWQKRILAGYVRFVSEGHNRAGWGGVARTIATFSPEKEGKLGARNPLRSRRDRRRRV